MINRNGANHPPYNSQSRMAVFTSDALNNVQPNPRNANAKYLKVRPNKLGLGDDKESGIPSTAPTDAAKEKLSTDEIDIIVDAKQRLIDFKVCDNGAIVGFLRLGGIKMANIGGSTVKTIKTTMARVLRSIRHGLFD